MACKMNTVLEGLSNAQKTHVLATLTHKCGPNCKVTIQRRERPKSDG